MAARSIASLSLGFGLVSIPVKLYSATESRSEVSFNLLTPEGDRVRQQYVSAKDEHVVQRSELVKGYEFEKGRFVLFTPDELKALQDAPTHGIEIVAFIPARSVDPIFYDKAYLLAPDKRGAKPYHLLREAMLESERCALARWAWKGRQHVVQVRAADDGLVLQQLLYADEVRSLKDLDIEQAPVSAAELKLALQLIEQIATDGYDPDAFEDEEKKRILAAIDRKIAGKEVVEHDAEAPTGGAQVIDLMEALRASLGPSGTGAGRKKPATAQGQGSDTGASSGSARKGARRSAGAEPAAGATANSRRAAKK